MRALIGMAAALICLMELGCSKENGASDMLRIDRNANGTEQTVAPGQEIEIALPENPTTGFRWELETTGEPALRLINDEFDSGQPGIGKGGVRRWRFAAVQEGRGDIVLIYRRAFERANPPADVFRFTARIQK